jgi:hypothetical protein
MHRVLSLLCLVFITGIAAFQFVNVFLYERIVTRAWTIVPLNDANRRAHRIWAVGVTIIVWLLWVVSVNELLKADVPN